MRIHKPTRGLKFVLPSLLIMVLLTGCGSADADATPTLSVDQIFTAAAQTLQAQQATQLALTPPTSTPSPSPFPTLPPPSPAATISFSSATPGGGGAGQCDNAAYVADVTIPDGTTMKPGEKFTKTWKIYNSGTCAWTTSYFINFVSGDAMGGASTALAAGVPSGSQADISVALTAPTTNGTFKGNWRLQNASGQPFGNIVYVEIKVGAGSTVTPGPSPTSSGTSFTISGSISIDTTDMIMEFSGATSEPTVTIGTGSYSFNVPAGWSGTFKPKKGNGLGWYFTPSTLSNVQENKTVNFTATPAVDGTPQS